MTDKSITQENVVVVSKKQPVFSDIQLGQPFVWRERAFIKTLEMRLCGNDAPVNAIEMGIACCAVNFDENTQVSYAKVEVIEQ